MNKKLNRSGSVVFTWRYEQKVKQEWFWCVYMVIGTKRFRGEGGKFKRGVVLVCLHGSINKMVQMTGSGMFTWQYEQKC